MKKTLLSLITILCLSSAFAITTITVIKSTDVDPYIYRYNYIDSLCAPEMYGTLQWAIRKALDTPDECIIVFNIPEYRTHYYFVKLYPSCSRRKTSYH